MRVFSETDVGLMRQSNQDACKTGVFPNGSAWAVVCDGMGGVNGGNIASEIAVNSISRQIVSAYREGLQHSAVRNLILSAIMNANMEVHDKALQDSALSGMGTTVVAAVVSGGFVHVAHAGDSRAYLIAKGEIRQITTDHSMVQEMVAKGDITQQQARRHPQKNIITRALGVEESIQIDYCEHPFGLGSLLLMCTDGLTNYVDDETIAALSQKLNTEELTSKLVEIAKTGGGGDNITVAVVENELLTGVDKCG